MKYADKFIRYGEDLKKYGKKKNAINSYKRGYVGGFDNGFSDGFDVGKEYGQNKSKNKK